MLEDDSADLTYQHHRNRAGPSIMDKMRDSDQYQYQSMVGVPIETLKPKQVRRKIDLTLWEKLW